MDINISAEKMLEVLIESGIDSTEAKAIICDLLLAASNPTPSRKPVQSQQVIQAAQPQVINENKPKVVYGDAVGQLTVEDIEQPEEVVVAERPRAAKKHKRISFDAFGGAAENLK